MMTLPDFPRTKIIADLPTMARWFAEQYGLNFDDVLQVYKLLENAKSRHPRFPFITDLHEAICFLDPSEAVTLFLTEDLNNILSRVKLYE